MEINDSWIAATAMACGYVHKTEIGGDTFTFSMNTAELNTFDIIASRGGQGRLYWDTVEGIEEARKAYVRACNGKPSRRDKRSFEPAGMPETVYA